MLHREKPITQTRLPNASVYTWLYRNDKDWLCAHYHLVSINRKPYQRVDWDRRDQETAIQVELISKQILSEKGKLTRVTKNETGRRVESVSLSTL